MWQGLAMQNTREAFQHGIDNNANQYFSMFLNANQSLIWQWINIDRHWDKLRNIGKYWSWLIQHFGSMSEIQSSVDRHWALIHHVPIIRIPSMPPACWTLIKTLDRCTQLLIANVPWLLTNTQRSWTVFHVSLWFSLVLTDGRTDKRYQMYYLPCFAVDNNLLYWNSNAHYSCKR